MRPPLAVTMGEPAGVGPELVAMSWMRREAHSPPFYCIADPTFLSRRLEDAGLRVPIEVLENPGASPDAFADMLPVVATKAPVRHGVAGNPSPEDAAAVIQAIERAVSDVRAGAARAVVTAPVHKETLYGSGFAFPGHTEFLGELTRGWGGRAQPVMMLAAGDFRVVPVTIHVPIREVPKLLTENLIVETGRIVAEDLASRFGIGAPRIAVSGLNPHAGEGSKIGTEDRDIVTPAVERLKADGIDVAGPFAADTLFHPAARTRYDAALTMYHDQALIPIKTVAFDSAVNVTLGLPLIRTSPDHGTALSLAGSGRANPSSFIAALHLADQLSARP